RNCSAAAQAQPGSRGPAGGDAEEADCEEKEARCDTDACACCCPRALGLGSGTIRNQLSLAAAITGSGAPGRREEHSRHRVRHPAVVIDRGVAEDLEVLVLARSVSDLSGLEPREPPK